LRRIIGFAVAFVVVTATIVFLPVYSPPTPEARPVKPAIQEIELGSFEAPVEDAPSSDTPPVPDRAGGATPDDAGAPATGSTAPETSAAAPSAGSGTGATTGAASVPAVTLSRPHTDEFSTLGVTWAADDAVTGVLVRVRTRNTEGTWSGWSDLEQEDGEEGAPTGGGSPERQGTAPYFTGPAHGVEVVVQASGRTAPADVSLQLIDPGTSPADASVGKPQVTDQADAAAAMPAIYSRKQWGADESLRKGSPEYSPTIKAAVIHHTDGSNDYATEDVPGILRGIYAYHVLTRGWADIGYNVLVDKFGRAWEGRYSGDRGIASPVIGAHTGGFNTDTFGVSMIGNYDTADTPAAMIQTVAAVVAWKFSLYGVNPKGWTTLTSAGGGTSKYAAGETASVPTVLGHRDVGSTACPGRYGYAQLPVIRDLAAQRMAAAAAHDPRGSLDAVSLTASGFSARGWAFDPDAPSSASTVSVEVDGKTVARVPADDPRPDVGDVYPEAGDDHGFSYLGTLSNGEHVVCAFAENLAGSGSRNQIGCAERSFTNEAPLYSVDSVEEQTDGTLRLRGWAFDPDATPVRVRVYDNGHGWSYGTTESRPDVASSYAAAGPTSGFDVRIGPLTGSNSVCVYVVDTVAPGNTQKAGCTSLGYQAPVGGLDGVTETATGALLVRGWAVDQSVPTARLRVHVYVDGKGTSLEASTARPDVASRYPEAGAAHGFETTVPASPGTHRVCAYAMNVGIAGAPTTLGCRSVTLAYIAPGGVVDDVRAIAPGQVRVRGWMLDRSLPTTPVEVHVYVDGHGNSKALANGPRPDVARVYPGIGELHGLDTTLTLTPGTHSVCVFAINLGVAGSNRLLRCSTVTD
jgi:uncharacterized protein with LGFP repeats